MRDREMLKKAPVGWAAFPQLVGPAVEYATDLVQRQILFWDTLRQRGNQYREHSAKLAPHVLNYSFEVIADGRTFKRPVNYVLVRIVPPEGRGDQPEGEAIRDRRSPRRPWPRYRRLQGGQRNWRGDEGRPSLLLRRLPPRAHAGPNHRRYRRAPRRSSSKRSLRCTPRPMANRAWLEIARRAGPS